jgi:hypothetical protein
MVIVCACVYTILPYKTPINTSSLYVPGPRSMVFKLVPSSYDLLTKKINWCPLAMTF